MNSLAHFFQRIARALRGRYVRELESQVARLRAENRALVNSILGIAGIPSLPLDAAQSTPTVAAGIRRAPAKPASCPAALSPVRRRSWQQIGRMLEIQQARELAAAGATSPEFPAPAPTVNPNAPRNGNQ